MSESYEVKKTLSRSEYLDFRTQMRLRWKAFRLFLWDPYNGTCMGRSGKRWGKLLLFYFVYYGLLAAMFAIFLAVLIASLPGDRPRYEVQPMLQTPGMAIVPTGDTGKKTPYLEFDPQDNTTWTEYVQDIRDFLASYDADEREVLPGCDVDAATTNCTLGPLSTLLGNCDGVTDPDFGYSTGKPCVLLKLNKVYGWTPELYSANPDDDLLGARFSTTHIGISCEQKDDTHRDMVGVMGNVTYNPASGFPADCFPFCGAVPGYPAYLQPVVMVQFTDLARGEYVRAWCRAWAQNMEANVRDRAASAVIVFKVEQ